MKNTIYILILLITLAVGYFLGVNDCPVCDTCPIVEPVECVGAGEPIDVSEMLAGNCSCPPTELFQDVGCVDEIYEDNVRINGDKKVYLYDETEDKWKKYKAKDIVDSEIAETTILPIDIIDKIIK